MTNQEYDSLVKQKSPNSPLAKDMLCAFLVGGFICALGELLSNCYQKLGADDKTAASLVSISLVLLSIILTSLGIFDKIAKFAGAGTLVPITGFANAVASPAIEFKPEGHVLGVGAKMFVVAGPVIVFGLFASILYGIVLWIVRMLV